MKKEETNRWFTGIDEKGGMEFSSLKDNLFVKGIEFKTIKDVHEYLTNPNNGKY